jgi:Ca2+-binding EF-hand superfamily protein
MKATLDGRKCFAHSQKTEEMVCHYLEILKEKCRQKRKPRENEPQRLLRAFRYFDDLLVGSVGLPAFRKVLAQLGVPLSLKDCSTIYNRYPHTPDGNFDYILFVQLVYEGELV